MVALGNECTNWTTNARGPVKLLDLSVLQFGAQLPKSVTLLPIGHYSTCTYLS